MNNSQFINDNTVNIFTDGSVYHNKSTGETIGCAGAVVVEPFNTLNYTQILRDSTNNHCEIYSILLGINAILINNYHKRYKTINLFSDSKICILGLKEWIFNWVQNINSEGKMISSSNKEVANQELFSIAAMLIVKNNICINLYHQKGHINGRNYKDIVKAVDTFKASNRMNINRSDAVYISRYNDHIDVHTGRVLNGHKKEFGEKVELTRPFTIDMSQFDINRYMQLISGGYYNK